MSSTFSSSSRSRSGSSSTTSVNLPLQIFEVPSPPTDAISKIKFNNNTNNQQQTGGTTYQNMIDILYATSWDNTVSCWEIESTKLQRSSNERLQDLHSNVLAMKPKNRYTFSQPLLTCDVSTDGKFCFTGGVDGKCHQWDVTTSKILHVGQHDSGVKEVHAIEEKRVIVTGSWDATVKVWDLRTPPQPVMQVKTPGRVVAMDVSRVNAPNNYYLVVASGECYVEVLDLNMGLKKVCAYGDPHGDPAKQAETNKLQAAARYQQQQKQPSQKQFIDTYQTRCVSCFTKGEPGFALGTIEGRISISYFKNNQRHQLGDKRGNRGPTDDFSYKCHRKDNKSDCEEIYPVNAISFNIYGLYASSGSDGTTYFWNKDTRKRMLTVPQIPGVETQITSNCFNSNGDIFAFATGYDWSQGVSGNPAPDKQRNKIYLYTCTQSENGNVKYFKEK